MSALNQRGLTKRVYADMMLLRRLPIAPPTFAEVRLAAKMVAFKWSLGMNAETEKPLGALLGSGIMTRD